MTLSMYSVPFFLLEDKDIGDFAVILVIVSCVIAVEYALRYYYGYTHFLIRRVVTRQANIVLFTYPLILFAFFAKRNINKIILVAALFANVMLTVVSLQRSLWLIIFSDTVLAVIYYFATRGVTLKRIGFMLKITGVVLLVIIVGFFIIQQYIDIMKLVSSRLQSLSTSRISGDEALDVRKMDLQATMKLVQDNAYLGSGLGAGIFQKNTGLEKQMIDNSIAVLLHKMGIFGLIALLFMYGSAFAVGLKLLFKNRNLWFIFAVLLIMANYLIIGLSSSAVYLYRFNILIGYIFVFLYRYEKGLINLGEYE